MNIFSSMFTRTRYYLFPFLLVLGGGCVRAAVDKALRGLQQQTEKLPKALTMNFEFTDELRKGLAEKMLEERILIEDNANDAIEVAILADSNNKKNTAQRYRANLTVLRRRVLPVIQQGHEELVENYDGAIATARDVVGNKKYKGHAQLGDLKQALKIAEAARKRLKLFDNTPLPPKQAPGLRALLKTIKKETGSSSKSNEKTSVEVLSDKDALTPSLSEDNDDTDGRVTVAEGWANVITRAIVKKDLRFKGKYIGNRKPNKQEQEDIWRFYQAVANLQPLKNEKGGRQLSIGDGDATIFAKALDLPMTPLEKAIGVLTLTLVVLVTGKFIYNKTQRAKIKNDDGDNDETASLETEQDTSLKTGSAAQLA